MIDYIDPHISDAVEHDGLANHLNRGEISAGWLVNASAQMNFWNQLGGGVWCHEVLVFEV